MAIAIWDQVKELRQILGRQPEPVGLAGVGVEQHHPSARDAPQLAQPAWSIVPVMIAEHSHCDVEALVGKRQRLRPCRHDRRSVGLALRDHPRRRLDRYDVSIGRLIGARAWPDVEHRLSVTERSGE